MAPERFYVNLIFLSTQPKMHHCITNKLSYQLQVLLKFALYYCTAVPTSSSTHLSISRANANGAVLIGEVLMPKWISQ